MGTYLVLAEIRAVGRVAFTYRAFLMVPYSARGQELAGKQEKQKGGGARTPEYLAA